MPKTKTLTSTPAAPPTPDITDQLSLLTTALTKAFESAKPKVVQTAHGRIAKTPWTPPEGTPRSQFKRKSYHHGRAILESRVSNEEIDLMNKLKPGRYLSNLVTVTRRKDKGIDIDYRIRTNSDRLKLVNAHGIISFTDLLSKVIAEQSIPRPLEIEDLD